MVTAGETRPLTDQERRLARWMLEHGNDDARDYLGQLEIADATTWRCPCGCVSFNFKIAGRPEAPPGVHVLGDFIFGDRTNLAGIFIFASGGILSGLEVYGMAGEAPVILPEAESLRPVDVETQPGRKDLSH